MIDWQYFMHQKLESRERLGLKRKLSIRKNWIDFSSNDYLGLARQSTFKSEHNGSGGSRLLSGNSTSHEKLEAWLTNFHETESALLFNSGYDANVGLLSALLKKGDTVLFDELVHASIHDGMKMTEATCLPFKHNDLNDLKKQSLTIKGKVMVITESVFSMDGDTAPLQELAELCEEKNWALVVDEAHATGIFGNQGQGLVQALGIQNQVFARIHTFGKAVGSHGAAVLGSKTLAEYLLNYARSFIYSTAFSPAHADFTLHQYQHLKAAEHERQQLKMSIKELSSFMIEHFEKNYIKSESAIHCLLIHGNDSCRSFAEKLQKLGFDIRPILSPTVPRGKERIRICLHSFNTSEEMQKLEQALFANRTLIST